MAVAVSGPSKTRHLGTGAGATAEAVTGAAATGAAARAGGAASAGATGAAFWVVLQVARGAMRGGEEAPEAPEGMMAGTARSRRSR